MAILKLKYGAPAQVDAAPYTAGTLYVAKKNTSNADIYIDVDGTRLRASGENNYLNLQNIPLSKDNSNHWIAFQDLYIWDSIVDKQILTTEQGEDLAEQIVLQYRDAGLTVEQAEDMVDDIWNPSTS